MDTFWVHGNVASTEGEVPSHDPAEIVSVKHMGWGTVVHARPTSGGPVIGGGRVTQYYLYVHVPLANVGDPILPDQSHSPLSGRLAKRVCVLWTASNSDVAIDRVDVWNGANREASITTSTPRNSFSTRNTAPQLGANAWDIPRPFHVRFGLGLSLHFMIWSDVDIIISAAGIDIE